MASAAMGVIVSTMYHNLWMTASSAATTGPKRKTSPAGSPAALREERP